MSCQELLALSGALSAALPTGQVALDTFFEELTKGISKRAGDEKNESKVSNEMCYDLNDPVKFLSNIDKVKTPLPVIKVVVFLCDEHLT